MRSVIQSIEFDLPENDEFSKGLTKVRMRRLGGLVMLAGANGAGKTRLLDLVETHASGGFVRPPGSHALRKAFLGDPFGKIRTYRIPNLQALQMGQTLNSTQQDEDAAKHQLLHDATNYGANLTLAARMIKRLAIDHLDAGNPRAPLTDDEREARDARWGALQSMLGALLEVEASYDGDRHIFLNKKPIDTLYGQFSDGQKKLFAFSASLIGQAATGDPQVVIFDEPENSLHPQAAISMLQKMQNALSEGQLWIATHSIPLLAGLGMDSVWYADNGTISYGGNRTERVINGLIGGRENLFALRETIAEPDRIAMARFGSECLVKPSTVSNARADDPQFLQLESDIAIGTPLKVLDWGCGNGRLKVWLASRSKTDELFDYVGYEPDPKQASRCRDRIVHASGGSADFIYSNLSEIEQLAKLHGKFDRVVIANVLHEIPATDWLGMFATIGSLLKSEGRVLLLEDTLLPYGELPHLSGFLMVDKKACATLFGLAEAQVVSLSPSEAEYDDRLLGFSIPAIAMQNVTKESVVDCINELRDSSLLRVKQFREVQLKSHEAPDDLLGHRHAVAVMQFANAHLAAENLAVEKEARCLST